MAQLCGGGDNALQAVHRYFRCCTQSHTLVRNHNKPDITQLRKLALDIGQAIIMDAKSEENNPTEKPTTCRVRSDVAKIVRDCFAEGNPGAGLPTHLGGL